MARSRKSTKSTRARKALSQQHRDKISKSLKAFHRKKKGSKSKTAKAKRPLSEKAYRKHMGVAYNHKASRRARERAMRVLGDRLG